MKGRNDTMKNNENTALATTNSAFQALKEFHLNTALSDEMNGLTGSFERIKIPSGGMTIFEVPSDNPDEPENVKEFPAVILHHHPLNAFYKTKYTGGSNPPDCGSMDGICGNGTPGGECAKCPYNKFGSGENGAKACKNRRRIYLMREGEIFPMVLSLPTGSLKGFTRYIVQLISKGKNSNTVVTKFSLRKATNKGGVAYSQALFSVDRDLTPDEIALMAELTEQVKEYSVHAGFDADGDADGVMNVDPETGEVIEPLA